MIQANLFGTDRFHSAIISDDGVYRYRLIRGWDASLPRCCFVMLNPSVADHAIDDPTCRRCVGYAKAWGFGSLTIVNLFALRSTDPAALRSHPNPVGPENDGHILDVASDVPLVVAAWGSHGSLFGRSAAVRRLLRDRGIRLDCLAKTKGGEPGHPLYLPANLTPVPLEV